jgi:uncharacterized membrane protein
MPFCSQCGYQVGGRDQFCGRCGAPQPVAPGTPPPLRSAGPDALTGISGRTASILCYVPAIGWIASIIWLASEKFRHDRIVRFHAFQGLYLFVAWLMNDWVLRPLTQFTWNFHIYHLVQLALLGMSIFMMVKASRDEAYPLPLFGELAQRSVSEN